MPSTIVSRFWEELPHVRKIIKEVTLHFVKWYGVCMYAPEMCIKYMFTCWDMHFFLCMTIYKHACILKLVASIFCRWNSCIVLLVHLLVSKHATWCFSIQLMNVCISTHALVCDYFSYISMHACMHALECVCIWTTFLMASEFSTMATEFPW